MKECKDLDHTPGFLVSCLIEHRTIVDDAKCRSFLTKMSVIVFEDYRLIKGFYDDCYEDVKKTSCGQLSRPSQEVSYCCCSVSFYCFFSSRHQLLYMVRLP